MTIKKEIKRKAIHIGLAFIPLIIYHIPSYLRVFFLLAITFSLIIVDFLRLLNKKIRKILHNFFLEIIRPKELYSLTGATYYFISLTISFLAFNPKIALSVSYFLILGDAFAALVGKKLGRIKIVNNKTLEGALACFVVNLLIVVIVFKKLSLIGLIGALTGTLIELFSFKINDNFSIPILTGVVMQIALKLIEGY